MFYAKKVRFWLLIVSFWALNAQNLAASSQYYIIEGLIDDIQPRGGRQYLTVIPINFTPGKYTRKQNPELLAARKLRISVSKRLYPNLKIGDKVSSPAMLKIPEPPIAPNGFDWREYLARKQIDATGYIAGKLQVVEPTGEQTFKYRMRQTRLDLAERLYTAAPTPQTGAFAAALLTGVRGYLSKQTVEDMRRSGLAHLLAISGMHMAMVAGLIYMLVRRTLAFQYRVNGKKIAAAIAIVTAFGYLMLAGAPVSTQRAFIMTAIVLLAVLVDRQALSLWSLGLAAIAVLAIDAQAILGAGFQLSFAAAGILVLYYRRKKQPKETFGLTRKLGDYFWGVFVVTMFINFITGPIVAYHFHQVPTYGALGNLVAIPLTGLLIMPFLMMALLLVPFGLEHLALSLAHWPLWFLEATAHFLSGLPHAVILFGPIPLVAVLLSTAGLFYILAAKKYRWVGALPVIVALIVALNKPEPKYIITHDGKMLGKIEANKVTAIGWKPSKFVAEKWAQHYGKENFEVIKCKEDPCQLDQYVLAGMYKSIGLACKMEGVTVVTKLNVPGWCRVLKAEGVAQEVY